VLHTRKAVVPTLIIVILHLCVFLACRKEKGDPPPTYRERRDATIQHLEEQIRLTKSMTLVEASRRSERLRCERKMVTLLQEKPADYFEDPKVIEAILTPLDSGKRVCKLNITYLEEPCETHGFYVDGSDYTIEQTGVFDRVDDCIEGSGFLLVRWKTVLFSTVDREAMADLHGDRLASFSLIVFLEEPIHGMDLNAGLLGRTGERSPPVAITHLHQTRQQSNTIFELKVNLSELMARDASKTRDYLIDRHERALDYLKNANISELDKPQMVMALLFSVASSDSGEFVLRVGWLEEGFQPRQCIVFQGTQDVARSERFDWKSTSDNPLPQQARTEEFESLLYRHREFRVVVDGSVASTQPAEDSLYGGLPILVVSPEMLKAEFSVGLTDGEDIIKPIKVYRVDDD